MSQTYADPPDGVNSGQSRKRNFLLTVPETGSRIESRKRDIAQQVGPVPDLKSGVGDVASTVTPERRNWTRGATGMWTTVFVTVACIFVVNLILDEFVKN